jgi:hypothetical protein
MNGIPVIRKLCFVASGVLVALLLFSAIVSGSCGDGGTGAGGCAHSARLPLLVFGGGALLIGLVGVRLIGWEDRRRDEEERAARQAALLRRRAGEAGPPDEPRRRNN